MVLLIFASSTFCRRHHPRPTSHEITILDHVDHDLQINPHLQSPPAPAPTAPPLPPPPPVPATQPAALDVETTNPLRNKATLQRGGIYYDATRHQLPSPKPQPPTSRVEAAMRNNTSLGGKRRDTDDVSATQLPPPKVLQPTPPPQLGKGKDVVIEESDDNHEERRRRNGEEDTMEATWEAITGGGRGKKQQMKKKREAEVKKKNTSTWVDVERVRRLDSEEVVPSSPKWKELRKAETFNDAVSLTRRGGLIRKVPSMSLEDFNHKVEAFINGFNSTLRHKSKRTFFDIINQNQKRR